MPITYAPANGTILICTYSGIKPEMEKKRPVVLLSSIAYRLCLVVPLSTTWPKDIMPWHYFVKLPERLPGNYKDIECWAKCDMVSHASFDRLELLFNGKEKNGKRRYQFTNVGEEALEAIRACVVRAIGG